MDLNRGISTYILQKHHTYIQQNILEQYRYVLIFSAQNCAQHTNIIMLSILHSHSELATIEMSKMAIQVHVQSTYHINIHNYSSKFRAFLLELVRDPFTTANLYIVMFLKLSSSNLALNCHCLLYFDEGIRKKLYFIWSQNLLFMCKLRYWQLGLIYIGIFPILVSEMFEQRMLRPQSDQFYFQLEPQILTVTKSPTIKTLQNAHSTFTLKLMKGLNLCDETKKPTPEVSADGTIVFEKTQLTFYLPSYNPERPIDFKLILLRTDQGKQQKEVTKYFIKSGDFIELYKKQQIRRFQQTIQFNPDYQLQFDLYIDKSRIQLEKQIRSNREKEKLGASNQQKKQQQLTKNQKSEKLSSNGKERRSSSNGDKFTSPERKLVRKQGHERRLLTKNGSPQRSQKSQQKSVSQRSKQPKFTRTKSPKSPRSPRLRHENKESLADQQIKIQKQARRIIQENNAKQRQQKNHKNANTEEKNSLNALTQMIKADKKAENLEDGILDDADGYKSPREIKKGGIDEEFKVKKTSSTTYDPKGNKPSVLKKPNPQTKEHNIQHKESSSNQNQGSSRTANIGMAIFLLISCFVLYLVMFPSRKF